MFRVDGAAHMVKNNLQAMASSMGVCAYCKGVLLPSWGMLTSPTPSMRTKATFSGDEFMVDHDCRVIWEKWLHQRAYFIVADVYTRIGCSKRLS